MLLIEKAPYFIIMNISTDNYINMSIKRLNATSYALPIVMSALYLIICEIMNELPNVF